ncbi:MAG: hypothetical protein ACI4SU_00235, partial [Anaerovoracaceae bacterium]
INITVHMDPVKTDDPNRAPLSELIRETISTLPGVLSFHDLRFVAGPTHTNVIFDIVINHDCKMSEAELQKIFNDRIQAYNPTFFAVIDVDKNYVALK